MFWKSTEQQKWKLKGSLTLYSEHFFEKIVVFKENSGIILSRT